MRYLLLVLALLLPARSLRAQQCSEEAVAQATKLLAFHTDGDDRASVDSVATELPSILNPANESQQFAVLQVWGYVYQGEYRMRFIFYRMEEQCVLMGQEILEYASL